MSEALAKEARRIGLTCPDCGASHKSAHREGCRRPNGKDYWASTATAKQVQAFIARKAVRR